MNTAYFENGELYNVSPRSNSNLYEDRDIAYRADILVSDYVAYDLHSESEVRSIKIPAFRSETPSVLELSYIMKIRCGCVKEPDLIPAFVQKTLELMDASTFSWHQKDYLQVIRNYRRVGLIEDGKRCEAEFLNSHGNLDEELKQQAQKASLDISRELEDDALEITAHGLCSLDHEPIQGRVFLLDEYEKMQNGQPFCDIDGNCYKPLMRPIGSPGCLHFATGFSTWRSKRKWTDNQLRDFYELNHKKCLIDDKEYTRYEAYALMQNIESEVRAIKSTAVCAAEQNDMPTRVQCQKQINELMKQYHHVAKTAEISPRTSNIQVYGFRAVKVE